MPFCPRHNNFYKGFECRECVHDKARDKEDKAKIEAKREKQLLKAKLKAQEPKKAMKRVSDKQKTALQEYNERVKVWKVENPKCKAKCNSNCTGETVDNHHRRGRGKYLMDESTWLPVCRSCHDYIGQHTHEAYDKGWSQSRLENLDQEKQTL